MVELNDVNLLGECPTLSDEEARRAIILLQDPLLHKVIKIHAWQEMQAYMSANPIKITQEELLARHIYISGIWNFAKGIIGKEEHVTVGKHISTGF